MLSAVLGTALYAGGHIEEVVEDIVIAPKAAKVHSANLKIGTLGVGVDYIVPLKQNLQARVNINGFKYEDDDNEIEGIVYDSDLTLFTAGVLVDYFISDDSRFHITAGAYYNGNKLEATAKPKDNGITIGDNTYFGTDNILKKIDIDVEFDEFAPYVGIGWSSRETTSGWSFIADLGVMYQGKGDVTLTPEYGVAAIGPVKTLLDQNIKKEQLELQDAVDDYEYYPVIMVGATYRF